MGDAAMPVAVRSIQGTTRDDHIHAGRPYVVVVGTDDHSQLSHPGSLGLAVVRRELAGAPGPVTVLVRLERASSGLDTGSVRMDQTVRTALGLPSLIAEGSVDASSVSLHRLTCSMGDRINNWVSGLCGRRYLLLRVSQPNPQDIEKNLCRVGSDDLIALGADAGSKLVFFTAREEGTAGYFLTRTSLQTLPLSSEAALNRRQAETEASAQGWSARYRCSRLILGIEGSDLSDVFLDSDSRADLHIDRCSPVLVRRDSLSAMARELLEFGVVLLASLLAIQGVLGPLLVDAGLSEAGSGVVALAVALAVSMAFVIARLRADLR